MNSCKVSVIIPVYNVRDYLNECLESVVAQTFSDIEILLIVRHSTDGTEEKVEEWRTKDVRIKIYYYDEKGLGPARNYGIQEATTDYIIFVDSDDTVRNDFVEKLYNAITENDADMAECNYLQKDEVTGQIEHVMFSKCMGQELTLKEKMRFGNVAMWRRITKKSLWTDNSILQPFLPAEDMAVYPLLVVYAKKIVYLEEELYIYRKAREGSLISRIEVLKGFSKTIEFVLDEFKKRNIFDKYEEELEIFTCSRIERLISICLTLMELNEYQLMQKNFLEVYSKFFGKDLKSSAIIGGNNTTKIINKLAIYENPYLRFQFSSIIALTSPVSNLVITHTNKYRNYMLQREIKREIWSILEKEKSDYLFLDFLEERHDILKIDKCYYTYSDAFQEAKIHGNIRKNIIKRCSPECRIIWEEKIHIFMRNIYELYLPENIFLIKNYLCTEYGDGCSKWNYQNIDEIEKINAELQYYYEYVQKYYPDIKVVEVRDLKNYYTDVNYPYGCYPWHLNEKVNQEIADRIQEVMV